VALVGISLPATSLFWLQGRWRPVPEVREIAAALKEHRPKEALALLDRRSGSAPLSAPELMLKAEARIQLGRHDEALADLSRIADTDPSAPRARLVAGQVELWRRNRARPAERALLAALALDPGLIDARRDLSKLYDIQGRNAERDAQFRTIAESSALSLNELLSWCRTKRPDGETREIVALLERFLAADPADERSRVALARQLQRLGRLDEAEEILAGMPELSADVVSIRLRIAAERGDRQRRDELLAMAPDRSAEVNRIRGAFALMDRDGATALRLFQQARELEPSDRETLLGLGQACRLVKDDAGAATWLGRIGQMDALEALVQRAVTGRNQRDVTLLHRIATACEAAGRPDLAIAWHGHVLGVDPLYTPSQQALFRLRRTSPPAGQ
jgi:tetratricopeptide (TPR) repeat protein